MSTFPTVQSILLEIHQSLGCPTTFSTKEKTKFSTEECSLQKLGDMGHQILSEILTILNLDPNSQVSATYNLEEFANAYKSLELKTWTFEANGPEIIWMLSGYFFMPHLGRRVAFWNLDSRLDKGMPAGSFWYLPTITDTKDGQTLSLPVTQVVDWLLDLLGGTIEQIGVLPSNNPDLPETDLRRSLYNWRKQTTPSTSSIESYFPKGRKLEFKGTFVPDLTLSPEEQFNKVLDFVNSKGLTADRLRFEIPITNDAELNSLLAGTATEEQKENFVACITERYQTPSMRQIRQRLLLARAVQDGYIRLLKYLCPQVDRLCADPEQNKTLQLFEIYKTVYNATVGGWRFCKHLGENVENKWFEDHLPEPYKSRLFISVLPSHRESANNDLSRLLTRHFFESKNEDELENHIGLNTQMHQNLVARNLQRDEESFKELKAQQELVNRMKVSSPWRALQNESSYWVVSQAAQTQGISPKASEAATQRLKELAHTPVEAVQCICLTLHNLLNTERNKRPKDVEVKVKALLAEAEASAGYPAVKAGILQYKAKHHLAKNEFTEAEKLFRQALDACEDRNYGPLKGEIARDALATAVANRKLIPENHEKYYRNILSGGIFESPEPLSLEDTAKWASEYFWRTLYKAYPDVEQKKPLAAETAEELLRLSMVDEGKGLSDWINRNSTKLNNALPMATGETLLMLFCKFYNQMKQRLPIVASMMPIDLRRESRANQSGFEAMQKQWRQAVVLLTQQTPKQLNIPDYKNQTPLMLMAEAGDTEMVSIMLQAGANPELQDIRGMTALHSAIKSGVNSCVDTLLDHPCRLNIMTEDGQTPLHTAAWVANQHAIKRLLKLAPELAWQRNAKDKTPLEYIELFVEEPEALEALNNQIRKNNRSPITKHHLEAAISILELAPPVMG